MLISHTPLNTRLIHAPRKKYDIAFVIPCYDEGSKVIDTLYSLVVQKNITKYKERICVFLVLNNPASRNKKTYESNKITSELVCATKRWKYLVPVLQNPKLEKDIVTKIMHIFNSKIHITLVDLYSDRFAPEVCNVGIARDIGVKSALPYLKNENSIICNTDADCAFEENFLEELISGFGPPNNPKYNIATGERKFIPPNNKKGKKLYDIYEKTTSLEEAISSYLEIDFENKKTKVERKPIKKEGVISCFTPGSYLVIRKHLFEKIGGFPHIGGAEDIFMGTQAYKLGYEVGYLRGAISTESRISERAESGHSYGQDIKRASLGGKFKTASTYPIEYFEKKLEIEKAIFDTYNQKKGILYLKKRLKKIGLEDIEIQSIINTYISSLGGLIKPGIGNIRLRAPNIFSYIKILLRKKYNSIPVSDLLKQLDQLYMRYFLDFIDTEGNLKLNQEKILNERYSYEIALIQIDSMISFSDLKYMQDMYLKGESDHEIENLINNLVQIIFEKFSLIISKRKSNARKLDILKLLRDEERFIRSKLLKIEARQKDKKILQKFL